MDSRLPHTEEPEKVARVSRSGFVLIAVLLTVLVSYGPGVYVFALFLTPLEAEFGWDRSVLGAAMGFFWLAGPLSPVIGRWVDRYGAKIMFLIGAALESGGFIVLTYIDSAWELYAIRTIMGLGKIFILVAMAVAIPQWFDRHMGLALGLCIGAVHAGGLIFAPLTQPLFEELGWRSTALLLGVIIGAISIPALSLCMPSKKVTDARVKASRESQSADHQGNGEGYTLGEALRSRLYIVLIGLALLFYSAQMGAFSQLVPYFSDLNFSGQWTANLMAVLAGVATIAVVAFGAAADRLSHKVLMVVGFGLMGFGLLSVIALSSFSSELWAVVAILAFGLGLGIDSLWYSVLRTSFGDKDYGAIYGFWYIFSLLPFMLAPILVGYAYDTMHSYIPVFFGLLVLLGLGTGLSVMPSFQPASKIRSR